MTSLRTLHRIGRMDTTKPDSKPAPTSTIEEAPPIPPEEPDAFACCGNDCGEACVWSIYRYEQKLHAAALDAWHARQGAEGDEAEQRRGD